MHRTSKIRAGASVGALLLVAAGFVTRPATADPATSWDEDFDCVDDDFNPIDPATGLRDPEGDPAYGTPEWEQREYQRVACADQRSADNEHHPTEKVMLGAATYGDDHYRLPQRFDGVRFRYVDLPLFTIPNVPAAEMYLPCDAASCPDLPEGLERFEAPYPVVVIHHGFIGQYTHHRFQAQTFAENGYLAITVAGTHPAKGPNYQQADNGADVLAWLESPASGTYGEIADLDRVVMAGHSQGSAAALSNQGDPRVDAILAWDGGDAIADVNCTIDPTTGEPTPCAPIMYQRTDGAFAAALNEERTEPVAQESFERGYEAYHASRERGLDVFHITLRATTHVDWTGYGDGLAGNRLAELVINYYNLAWLDRHARGALAFDADGNLKTYAGRTAAEERAFRQAIAQDAFDRLTALRFPAGSIDQHNTSMGYYDQEQHLDSGDLLWGGNVPYAIEGLWTTDRLSTDYPSICSISVPNYVGGFDGTPAERNLPDAVVATAETGPDTTDEDAGDMRFSGCR